MSHRAQPPTKNTVSLQLTEPVIFLRGSADSVVRGRNPENGVPQPAILRGLLTLTLVKPTKITSIDVDLEGWARSAWPEGIGARSIEMSEEHKILSASTVFFRAGHHPHTHILTTDQQHGQDPPSVSTSVRRAASVGPGLALDWDDDQEVEPQYIQDLGPPSTSNANTNSIANNSIEVDSINPPPDYTLRRRASADYSTYNTTAVEHNQPDYVYIDDPPSFDDTISSPIIGPVGGALSPIRALSPIALSSPFTPHTPPRGQGQGHVHTPTHLQAPQYGRTNSSGSMVSGSGSSLRVVPEGTGRESLTEERDITNDGIGVTTESQSGAERLSSNTVPYTHANLSSGAASTHSSESDSSFVLSPLPETVLSRLPLQENVLMQTQNTASGSHSHSSLALSPGIQSQSSSPMSSSTHVNRNTTIGAGNSNISSFNNILQSGRSRSRGRRMSAVPLTSNTRISGTSTVIPRSVSVSTNTQSMNLTTPDTSVLSHSNRNNMHENSRGALLNSPSHSSTYSPGSTPHHNNPDTQHSTRRHSSRFSLSAVSNALMEGLDAVKHRVRSRSRADGLTIGERQIGDPERRRSLILNGEGGERSARRQSGNFTNATHHHAHHGFGVNLGHGAAGFRVGVGTVPSRDASLERGHDGVHHNVHHRDMETIGESSASVSVPTSGKQKEQSTFGWLGEAFGHDHNQDNVHIHKGSTHGDGWKEFRKGTYTYPISFLIPNNSPPTLHCAFGSVSYTLRATAHRPGAFSTRLTTRREVTFVAAPGEDDLDETDSILVQRQWEDQMHYVIAVHGKAYPVGGKIPLSLTFMPLAKIKLYRLSAYIEEHVEYYSNFKRLVRAEAPKKFDLLSLKHSMASKDNMPLPILPLDDSYIKSPLYGLVLASDDDEAASSVMGPGPWTLHKDLKLPHSSTCKYHDRANRNGQGENTDAFGREYGGGLHFTNKHKRSNIAVTHFLKVVLRVERGDDQIVDPKTGKRRLFDIVIQMPIHILSCQCNAHSTSLPLYSLSAPSFSQRASTRNLTQLQSGNNESNDDFYVNDEQPPAFHSNYTSSSNVLSINTNSANSTNNERVQSASLNMQADRHLPMRPSPGFSVARGTSGGAERGRRASPSGSIAESVFSRNLQFARLVAGHESESGEAPPDYEANALNSAGDLTDGVRERPRLSLNMSGLEEEERGRSRIRRVGGVGDAV